MEKPKLNQSTEEKSRASASFFWIRALPKPSETRTFASVMKMVTAATTP